ncbi:MAG: F0F1 ATP synthase subunit A [Candidatus Portnoybacteria bacterium]|nr:F0F1 ATP synthase subunit A [Candidatus Portnoybacteria bacterium]
MIQTAFAAENGQTTQVSHEHTLYSEPVFHVGSLPITNSMINSWGMVFVVIILSLVLRSKIRMVPGFIQNAFEMTIEGFFGIFDSVTGSRQKTMKFFPIVFTFFLFILINNWLGILPGVGSIGNIATEEGHQVFIPFFRGGTADLNTTLALAIIGVTISHIFGVFAIGFWNYLNKFINLKALIEIPKKIRKDFSVVIVNPIKLFVGFIEIIGEAAKVASLSFRLFGNIFAGEVLLASMAALFAFGLPIPFLFLEILVGLIQALIFAMLILIYLTTMTTNEEH